MVTGVNAAGVIRVVDVVGEDEDEHGEVEEDEDEESEVEKQHGLDLLDGDHEDGDSKKGQEEQAHAAYKTDTHGDEPEGKNPGIVVFSRNKTTILKENKFQENK